MMVMLTIVDDMEDEDNGDDHGCATIAKTMMIMMM